MNKVFLAPKRITITIPHSTYQYLVERSDKEGRSLSNLSAFLLESAAASDLNSTKAAT